MNKEKFVKISRFILLILAFLFVFALFNGKIWDPDFWWHLKTGEYISQTKSLPKTDPFAFTSLPKDPLNPESTKIKFILTQYWLAQIIFYWIYHFSGFQGIIFLRALILTTLIFLLYRGIRRERVGFYSSLLILIPAVITFANFTGERPQLFSFLFVFLLIYMLEGFRKTIETNRDASRLIGTENATPPTPPLVYLLPLPFIMLLWANIHGGFILGIILILGYVFSEIIKYFVKKIGNPLPLSSIKTLIAAGFISVLCSFINPNGYNIIAFLLEVNRSIYTHMIVEFKSPVIFIGTGFYNQELITYFILLLLAGLLFLINIKKLDLTDISLFIILAAMSLSAARVIPFFAPFATLMIARYGSMTIKKFMGIEKLIRPKQKIERSISFLYSSLISILFSAFLSIILMYVLITGNYFKGGIRTDKYPEGAMRFLKNNQLPGNMFNPYVWGGYLIWGLYPDYKVFIDGRALIEEVFFQMDRILNVSTLNLGGLPKWKALLNAYDINFIITFSVNDFTGKLIPLVPALLEDSEWSLIYMDNNSLIFLRNSPENQETIKRFAMPKEWLWNEVVIEAAQKALNFRRRNPDFYITMGDAFFAKKSYYDAKVAYSRALEISPGSQIAKERLDLINAYAY
ncbi:MAG: hypothetical protein AB1638_08820 [Nitrospirota bacterium]